MRILTPLILALLGLTSCTAPSSTVMHQVFDERTGNTLFAVSKPIVFARDRTDVAAHERDYATLVAIQLDHSGQYIDYLLLYRWSTVDPRMSSPPQPQQGDLRILADGRAIDLKPLADLPLSLARSKELHVPVHGDVLARAYPADGAMLQYIAASRELTLRMPEEELDAPFSLYEDGRAALQQFADSTNP